VAHSLPQKPNNQSIKHLRPLKKWEMPAPFDDLQRRIGQFLCGGVAMLEVSSVSGDWECEGQKKQTCQKDSHDRQDNDEYFQSASLTSSLA
jgi:hypothetical protein